MAGFRRFGLPQDTGHLAVPLANAELARADPALVCGGFEAKEIRHLPMIGRLGPMIPYFQPTGWRSCSSRQAST